MPEIKTLRPVNGARVLDPDMIPPSPLPKEGRPVVMSSWWRRRLRAGEVEEVPAAKIKTEKPVKEG